MGGFVTDYKLTFSESYLICKHNFAWLTHVEMWKKNPKQKNQATIATI